MQGRAATTQTEPCAHSPISASRGLRPVFHAFHFSAPLLLRARLTSLMEAKRLLFQAEAVKTDVE